MNNSTMQQGPCAIRVPKATEYFQNIDTADLALICVAGCFTVFVIIFFIIKIVLIISNFNDVYFKQCVLWVSAVFPLAASLSLLAACVPRAAATCDICFHIYAARCLLAYVDLIVYLFGDRKSMLIRLKGVKITINPPPCCCFGVFPKPNATRVSLVVLEVIVVQCGIIRVLTNFITSILTNDSNDQNIGSGPRYTFMVLNIVATIAAIHASNVLSGLASCIQQVLECPNIAKSFKMLQICMVIFNIQGAIINLIAQRIACTTVLPSQARGNLYNHLLVTLEMLIISIMGAIMLRPSTYGRIHELLAKRHLHMKLLHDSVQQNSMGTGKNGVVYPEEIKKPVIFKKEEGKTNSVINGVTPTPNKVTPITNGVEVLRKRARANSQ